MKTKLRKANSYTEAELVIRIDILSELALECDRDAREFPALADHFEGRASAFRFAAASLATALKIAEFTGANLIREAIAA